jgi:ferredoxin
MRGTSWIRQQDDRDPLLARLLDERGLDEVPLYARALPDRARYMRRWAELAPLRDGPTGPERSNESPEALAARIKRWAEELGADLVGIARMRPEFLELDTELGHAFVVAIGVHEDYAKVLDGPDAVDIEAFRVYARCAEIATGLAERIRLELGFPAWAHHNGVTQIQAIPVLYHAGFGELGKHGSLINPRYGAHFRPGFVTTDAPLAVDAPRRFGVQDYCINCRLCTAACPGDAIGEDYIVTGGVKRWLVDTERCYPFSRLRPEYCHLCVDVCPYIHKANGEPRLKDLFRAFVRERKEIGFGAPKTLGDRDGEHG